MSGAYEKFLIGDTAKFTWVNSGVTMAPEMVVYDGGETVVDTGTLTSSGSGHYFYLFTVPSSGYFNLKATGFVNSTTYIRSLKLKGVTGNVD